MKDVTADMLAAIDTFKDVPPAQLQWFIDNSSHYLLAPGDYLFKSGDPIAGTHIVISGILRLCLVQNNSYREISQLHAHDIIGYLPYSRAVTASAFADAITEAQVMTFPKSRIDELIRTQFELTQALVHFMTQRVRDFTTLELQNEKMMALGKLSAGLAHELNNPAAAIVRDSISLKKHLQLVPESFKEVIAIRIDEKEVDVVNDKMFEVINRKEKPVYTLMQRMAREDELNEWFEENEVNNDTDIAESFTDYGFTVDDLEDFKKHIPTQYLSPIFNWINNNLVTDKMVCGILESSSRISDLVGAVKSFTHMDRAQDKQYADIHTGIRNTLTMLQYKFKKGNIRLVENFDLTLPPVSAYIGELNQVWTNLIDNALDAMEPQKCGTLEIRTERDGGYVKVSVIDSGPGVPDSIKTRIFEPFFTTKEVGKGTGLGLDVVTRIIKQHNGSIKLHSVAGRTAFVVCFPIVG